MSVAFTREESAETAAEVELPDRPISPHANLVTASGLEALANAMAEYRAAYNAAHGIEDVTERRRARPRWPSVRTNRRDFLRHRIARHFRSLPRQVADPRPRDRLPSEGPALCSLGGAPAAGPKRFRGSWTRSGM